MIEKERRIAELEQELSATQQERDNNKAAADILTEMINNGEAE